MTSPPDPLPWTAAILAGGRASRLGGQDKGALQVGGVRIIDRLLAELQPIAEDVLIVANDPGRYADLGVRVVRDALPGRGALGGIYTALLAASTEQVVVVACDMPFLGGRFIRQVAERGRDVDVAIPRTASGYEPLCASYQRRCAERIRDRLARGHLKAIDVLTEVTVAEIGPEELAVHDPHGLLFFNVNTPEDYARALSQVAHA